MLLHQIIATELGGPSPFEHLELLANEIFLPVLSNPQNQAKWGEVPIAFVTLKPDTAATEAELIAHTRDALAHFKAPKRIVFGELPRNATGKIQKFVLRERAKSLMRG